MIVCSCNVISYADIEEALVEIMRLDQPLLPTPGFVWKHPSRKMRCYGCAPLAVETTYAKMEKLEREGAICACKGKSICGAVPVPFAPER